MDSGGIRHEPGVGSRHAGDNTYRRIKTSLDAVPAVDTHDHLWPFDRLPGTMETERGKGMNLAGLWRSSYFPGVHRLTPWTPGMASKTGGTRPSTTSTMHGATSFYRYQLPAFQDLYGVDFDRITDAQALRLDERIFDNYRTPMALPGRDRAGQHRAHVQRPLLGRLEFKTDYPFGILVFNVTTLVSGFHSSEFKQAATTLTCLPASKVSRSIARRLPGRARQAVSEGQVRGAACLKTTLAYQRTLTVRERAQGARRQVFGQPRSELTIAETRSSRISSCGGWSS